MKQRIQKAMESLNLAQQKINKEKEFYRPHYHFTPPAYWMNDPNGTIYYRGKYHLFYQHNPYENKWGHIHWGHAISEDLIHWKHLPIALAPKKDQGEKHVFSGCLSLDKEGKPKILYTSIHSILNVWKGAEQWAAESGDKENLVEWKRVRENPIMKDDIHGDLKVRNWRDPFIWKDPEKDKWFMLLGGNVAQWKFWKKRGGIFIYESEDLMDWNFLGIFYQTPRNIGKIVECPTLIHIEEKAILIISTVFDHHIKYAIGEIKNNQFIIEENSSWNLLDYGDEVYATNVLTDPNGKAILFAWIKGKGFESWKGMICLPRIIDLTIEEQKSQLIQKPIPTVKKLRKNLIYQKTKKFKPNQRHKIQNSISRSLELEIIFSLKLSTRKDMKNTKKNEERSILGINFNDGEQVFPLQILKTLNSNPIQYKIKLNSKSHLLRTVKEKQENHLHIFVDNSVLEVFINNREVMTSRFYPKQTKDSLFNIIWGIDQQNLNLSEFNVWNLG